MEAGETVLTIRGEDRDAGLALTYEFESLPGGALRARATVVNLAEGDYLLEGLDIALPVDERLTEVLDFTGRHERERTPQRHALTDGLYLRESRGGRPGLAASTLLAVGTPGFDTDSGEVVAAHVAWSGNSVLRAERDAAGSATLGGGELLLPGEIALRHRWLLRDTLGPLRGLPRGARRSRILLAHLPTLAAEPPPDPAGHAQRLGGRLLRPRPDQLRAIADRAAAVGVERFVLDDGWFLGRRDDTRGLGDWVVDPTVWPEGLGPLADHVKGLGMQFGLWFEPEMVNPDSELFRAHPDWVLGPSGRLPRPHRHQQVLDLANPLVSDHLFSRMSAIIEEYSIDAVKWDHNRDLLEAGTPRRDGAPSVHDQTMAFYALLDRLAARHPTVAWESCASGGGRVDLGVLERVQRVWTSDMTDALARQQIQRWTVQLVAAGVPRRSRVCPPQPCDRQDLGSAVPRCHGAVRSHGRRVEPARGRRGGAERARPLGGAAQEAIGCCSTAAGSCGRPRPTPRYSCTGWWRRTAASGLIAHVQLDESAHNRGVRVRLPGLPREQGFRLEWEGPVDPRATSQSTPLPEPGPTSGVPVTGSWLGSVGFAVPRRRPATVTLVRLTAAAE